MSSPSPVSGPIHLPPTGLIHNVPTQYCLPVGQELVIEFGAEGKLTISDRHFFGHHDFPEGTFGAGSTLTGYTSQKAGHKFFLHYTYWPEGHEKKYEVEVHVETVCTP